MKCFMYFELTIKINLWLFIKFIIIIIIIIINKLVLTAIWAVYVLILRKVIKHFTSNHAYRFKQKA